MFLVRPSAQIKPTSFAIFAWNFPPSPHIPPNINTGLYRNRVEISYQPSLLRATGLELAQRPFSLHYAAENECARMDLCQRALRVARGMGVFTKPSFAQTSSPSSPFSPVNRLSTSQTDKYFLAPPKALHSKPIFTPAENCALLLLQVLVISMSLQIIVRVLVPCPSDSASFPPLVASY